MVEVANGRSLVWGAEAVQALRERLGVGGRTVGALPRGPRQNSRLGLPLLLMPEEARLLAEIGAVTLVSAPRPDPRQHSLVRGGPGTRKPWTCGSRGRTPGLWVPAVGGVWAPWIVEYCECRRLGSSGSGFGVGRSHRVRVPGFLRQGRLGFWDSLWFTSQALASFKRQQEQGFQEQSALAAEARETRRQELLEKIAEGQAAKKQKLEQESGASESQEAGAKPAASESEASASQAPGEPEEAGEGGSGIQGPAGGGGRSFGNPGQNLGPGTVWRMGDLILGFTEVSCIHLPQVPLLHSQGLQMGWPPCPGLPCWSSWPLLGLGPSRLGPWIGVSSPKTGPMLAVLPMSFATASTETCGSEDSSSVLLASSGVTSWSILVSFLGTSRCCPFFHKSTTVCIFLFCLFLSSGTRGRTGTLGNPRPSGGQLSKFD